MIVAQAGSGGGETIVVGSPGTEVSAAALDQAINMASQPVPGQSGQTRLVFAGTLKGALVARLLLRVRRDGFEAVHTRGEVRIGPGWVLDATKPWQLLSQPGDGSVSGLAVLGPVYPPPAWPAALDAVALPPGVVRIPAGWWLLPPGQTRCVRRSRPKAGPIRRR